jgi:hypothetical protein
MLDVRCWMGGKLAKGGEERRVEEPEGDRDQSEEPEGQRDFDGGGVEVVVPPTAQRKM